MCRTCENTADDSSRWILLTGRNCQRQKKHVYYIECGNTSSHRVFFKFFKLSLHIFTMICEYIIDVALFRFHSQEGIVSDRRTRLRIVGVKFWRHVSLNSSGSRISATNKVRFTFITSSVPLNSSSLVSANCQWQVDLVYLLLAGKSRSVLNLWLLSDF